MHLQPPQLHLLQVSCGKTCTPTISPHSPVCGHPMRSYPTLVVRLHRTTAWYNCRADLPLSAQAMPGASSWAGVQLWRWWSEPDAPYRRPSTTRCAVVWTVLLVGERLDEHVELGGIPPEIWAVVLGFVRHDTPPTLAAE